MKKLVIAALTLVACSTAYALPVGNPVEASLYTNGFCMESTCCDPCDPCFSWCDAWSIRLGFYGDYVYNRHLENKDNPTVPEPDRDVEITTMHTNAGFIALNICDRVDVFATLGATQLHIKNNFDNFAPGVSVRTEFGFTTEFSWSVGARATLWECDCWGVGIEGAYFRTDPDVDYFANYLLGEQFYFNSNNSTTYSEWQVGLGVAYSFTSSCHPIAFVPYAALKWSGGTWEFNDFIPIPQNQALINKLEPKKLWGWALGATWTYCDMVGVTVEGRWADEKALHVNGQFRF